MNTETSKLKPKADAIAQFRYGAEAQAIGVVEANGMVSLHGHDATHREKRLPLIASDQDLNPERSPLFSFEVKAERRTNSFVDHYQRPDFCFEDKADGLINSFVDHNGLSLTPRKELP
jgi:hypothetical protein